MHFYKVLLLLLLIVSVSCSNLLSSKPGGVISKSDMVDLLVDIQLTEASIRLVIDSASNVNDTTELRAQFAAVFNRNNVTPDEFNESLDYYMEHVDQLDEIYNEVIARLTEKDARLQSTIKPVRPFDKHQTENRVPANVLKNPWYRVGHPNDPGYAFHYLPQFE